MERQLTFKVHPSEGTLEEYCFNRLPETDVEVVVEHLFACPSCHDSLDELDQSIQLMKVGVVEYQTIPASNIRGLAHRTWGHVRTVTIRPGLGVAAGVAMLCVMAVLSLNVSRPGSSAFDAPVPLAAFRGGGDAAVNRAPAGRPLEFAIDVTDLPPSNAYRVEVVNATGKHIWDATVHAANGKLAARVPKGLNPGVYWVRLYMDPGKLLREFGLRLG